MPTIYAKVMRFAKVAIIRRAMKISRAKCVEVLKEMDQAIVEYCRVFEVKEIRIAGTSYRSTGEGVVYKLPTVAVIKAMKDLTTRDGVVRLIHDGRSTPFWMVEWYLASETSAASFNAWIAKQSDSIDVVKGEQRDRPPTQAPRRYRFGISNR